MKFYITFGQHHIHKVGLKTFDKDTVGVIEAENHREARDIAFELFGDKFFTTYDEDVWMKDEGERLEFFPKGYLKVN